jgi:hypothetical protein
VQAPVDVVWGKILESKNYDKMVPETAESEIYTTENLRHGQKRIWVRMKVGFPMLKLQFLSSICTIQRSTDVGLFKKKVFDDSAGYWYVVKHPDRSDQTRVYYSVEVSMLFLSVPQFVMDLMSKQALTDAPE